MEVKRLATFAAAAGIASVLGAAPAAAQWVGYDGPGPVDAAIGTGVAIATAPFAAADAVLGGPAYAYEPGYAYRGYAYSEDYGYRPRRYAYSGDTGYRMRRYGSADTGYRSERQVRTTRT